MKTCPSCGARATVLIVNLADQQRFCHNCSGQACPTFMAHYILTSEDVLWLRACGIDRKCLSVRLQSRLSGVKVLPLPLVGISMMDNIFLSRPPLSALVQPPPGIRGIV